MFKLENIRHDYDGNTVLELPHFEGAQGEHWLVLGLSGSGKTTLLHLIAGLLTPTQGTVHVAGEDVSRLSGNTLDRFRGRNIGIVFQQMHLLQTLTVRENLLLARYLADLPQDRQRVKEVLDSLDIGDRESAYPDELSVGERQRVTIARAVMNEPRLLLADEPTSALDDVRSDQVLNLLLEQAERYNATLVIATHDQRVKDRFDKHLDLNAVPA